MFLTEWHYDASTRSWQPASRRPRALATDRARIMNWENWRWDSEGREWHLPLTHESYGQGNGAVIYANELRWVGNDEVWVHVAQE